MSGTSYTCSDKRSNRFDSEGEAIATISGFLDVRIEGLPLELQRELDRVAAASEKYI